MRITTGSVVVVEGLPDPQAANPKPRRCIVARRVDDGTLWLVVAATTRFEADNLQDDEVALMFDRIPGRARTTFDRPTVAKCSWLAVVRESDCRAVGAVGNETLNTILQRVGLAVAAGTHSIARDDRHEG